MLFKTVGTPYLRWRTKTIPSWESWSSLPTQLYQELLRVSTPLRRSDRISEEDLWDLSWVSLETPIDWVPGTESTWKKEKAHWASTIVSLLPGLSRCEQVPTATVVNHFCNHALPSVVGSVHWTMAPNQPFPLKSLLVRHLFTIVRKRTNLFHSTYI